MKKILMAIILIHPGAALADGLEKSEVQKVIRQKLKEVRNCYEEVLKTDQTVKGKVRVSFTVRPDGFVSKAGIIEDGARSAALNACLLGKIMSWNFPPPRGGKEVSITYPFVFQP